MTTRKHTHSPAAAGSFAALFVERLDALQAKMDLVGVSSDVICREADVSRGTPARWRRITPKTVETLTALEAVVDRKIREAQEQGLLPVEAQEDGQ